MYLVFGVIGAGEHIIICPKCHFVVSTKLAWTIRSPIAESFMVARLNAVFSDPLGDGNIFISLFDVIEFPDPQTNQGLGSMTSQTTFQLGSEKNSNVKMKLMVTRWSASMKTSRERLECRDPSVSYSIHIFIYIYIL